MLFKRVFFNAIGDAIVGIARSFLVCTAMLLGIVVTMVTAVAAIDIAQSPLFLSTPTNPRVMLVMSRDDQLYIKAYTDYTPLDSTKPYTVDSTYNNVIDYYGYFDSSKCYTYSVSNKRFEPAGSATTTPPHQCSSQWSGNFLNWATMTRMDVTRKVLYGGYRSTDDDTTTVLERTMIPRDAHAFVKVFYTDSPTDMQKYTPYSTQHISLCNSTQGSGVSNVLSTAAYPPLLYVAGDTAGSAFIAGWPRWASGAIVSCTWDQSGIYPTTSKNLFEPNKSTGLNVRVQVCKSGLEETNCTTYPKGNKKPTGLLQKYSETGRPIHFGLMTGSYMKNKSGGVLRRNIGLLENNPPATINYNEIDSQTGLFINQGEADAGIINTINRLRISSYNFGDKRYGYSCGSPGITSFTDGQCIDWGNPLSEVYLEALRYFAGKANATGAFDANDASAIPSLPQVKWVDPTPSTGLSSGKSPEWCAYNGIIAISTGLNSFDTDQLSNDMTINSATETNKVGTQEGISGNYLVGCNASSCKGADGANAYQNLCTSKSVSNLADVSGICPEQPTFEGGYHIAGLAYYAHTNSLRSATVNNITKGYSKVDTFGIALAESLPKFEISTASGKIALLPACLANSSGTAKPGGKGWRTCGMTDLIVENLTYDGDHLVAGSLLINWEDSAWGNDHDMDGIERLLFCTGSSCQPTSTAPYTFGYYLKTIGCPNATAGSNDLTTLLPDLDKVTNSEAAVVTCVLQTEAGHALQFGYAVSGTSSDGANLTVLRPGSKDFKIPNPFPKDSGITPPPLVILTPSGSAAKLLENPLWYAAKYGSFVDDSSSKNLKPDLDSEWKDSKSGNPTGYFKATNPAKLEDALDNILGQVVALSASASTVAAANSTSLNTGKMIYQAKFNSVDWSGQLLGFTLNTDGTINTSALAPGNWDTNTTLSAIDSSKVFTSSNGNGVLFSWGNLTTSQKTYLKDGGDDPAGMNRLNWILGVKTTTDTLRQRDWLLGDIINSDPFYDEGSETVYVGANDGMLHAFDARRRENGGGAQKFAYIPKAVFPNLAKLMKPSYMKDGHQYFVNGSPFVKKNVGSKSILIGTTGAGGRSVFALDVTTPNAFSANGVLWEFTAVNDEGDSVSHPSGGWFTDAHDSDLGYTIGQPSIGQLPDNTWVVVFGNGYSSDTGKAFLFVVKLDSQGKIAEVIKIATNDDTANGLASPTLRLNASGRVDAAYAGDMLGNLWKFDLVKDEVALEGKPLFKAIDPNGLSQPITAKVEIGRDSKNSDYLIFFGTGKYFENGDNKLNDSSFPSSRVIQSLYGIRDKSEAVERDQLQQQTILGQSNAVGNNFRLLSKNTVEATERGWYVDLSVDKYGESTCDASGQNCTATGERVTEKPILNLGRVIFTTLTPYDSNLPCDPVGTTWFMAVDMLTGGELTKAAFDVNRDQRFDASDTVTIFQRDADGKVMLDGQGRPIPKLDDQGDPIQGFASGFQAIVAGMAKATLIETAKGSIDVVFSGIEALTTTASAYKNADRADVQAAKAATDVANAEAAKAAAALVSDPTATATATQNANKAAAQAIVAAANAIKSAAIAIGASNLGSDTLAAIIKEADAIIAIATPIKTSGAPLPSDLSPRLRDLLGLLMGGDGMGVQLAGGIIPKTWRQLQ